MKVKAFRKYDQMVALWRLSLGLLKEVAVLSLGVMALMLPGCRVDEDEPPDGMVLIPGGWFQMGDPFHEGDPDERPVHTVVVDAFYMDPYEVTVAQYRSFDPDHPGINQVPAHPVQGVNWYDAARYCNERSRRRGLKPCYDEATWTCDFTRSGYRLPTESEWEYAARGGLEGKRYPWGDDLGYGEANYRGTRGRDQWMETAPVGSFPPNGFVLYDMAGNLWEWSTTWYEATSYQKEQDWDPQGPKWGIYRVRRGGGWDSYPFVLRCAFRIWQDPADGAGMGFRCVRRVP